MLSSFLRLLCCCYSRKPESSISDERARLLQFQIPTTPSQPVHVEESSYRERMGTIVRTMEGKMVNVSSRLPFNLHNRVIHDSIGSRSRSQSLGYNSFDDYNPNEDDDSYRKLLHQQHSSHKQIYEQRYPVYYQNSQSRSPSVRPSTTVTEHEADRPAAILSLRLVGATQAERGRTRERTAKPTGLGGGNVSSSNKHHAPIHSTNVEAPGPSTSSPPQFELEFINPVLSSWNDTTPHRPSDQS